MKKKHASILITNYNKSIFLRKCLKSCVAQEFLSKEILVFDDKSTDNSISIIKKFKKVKLFTNKKKKYYSGPLNQIHGIIQLVKKCKGDIIFLLDGDDFFKKNKLERLIQIFEKNKNLNFLQDTPINSLTRSKMFLNKRLTNYTIWPRFFPTSSIVVRKTYFKNFLKEVLPNKFPNLEIDARITIYSHLKNQFTRINNSYTIYNTDTKGITSNYKKFRSKWWIKRMEAFNYMQYISKILKIDFKKGPDFYLTRFINFFLELK